MQLLDPANDVPAEIVKRLGDIYVPPTKRDVPGVPVQNADVQKMADTKRYEMFEQLCEVKKLLPHQLAACDIDAIAGWLVQLTGLPIEKFPPMKLRERIAEYVMYKEG